MKIVSHAIGVLFIICHLLTLAGFIEPSLKIVQMIVLILVADVFHRMAK